LQLLEDKRRTLMEKANGIAGEKCFSLLRFLEGILELSKPAHRAFRLVLIFILESRYPENVQQRNNQSRERNDPPEER
jgi:hypothetical protein